MKTVKHTFYEWYITRHLIKRAKNHSHILPFRYQPAGAKKLQFAGQTQALKTQPTTTFRHNVWFKLSCNWKRKQDTDAVSFSCSWFLSSFHLLHFLLVCFMLFHSHMVPSNGVVFTVFTRRDRMSAPLWSHSQQPVEFIRKLRVRMWGVAIFSFTSLPFLFPDLIF